MARTSVWFLAVLLLGIVAYVAGLGEADIVWELHAVHRLTGRVNQIIKRLAGATRFTPCSAFIVRGALKQSQLHRLPSSFAVKGTAHHFSIQVTNENIAEIISIGGRQETAPPHQVGDTPTMHPSSLLSRLEPDALGSTFAYMASEDSTDTGLGPSFANDTRRQSCKSSLHMGNQMFSFFPDEVSVSALRVEERSMAQLIHSRAEYGLNTKVWLFVPAEESDKVYNLAHELFGLPSSGRQFPEQHGSLYFSPRLLLDRGIRFQLAVQRPGDLVFTKAGVLHQVVTFGRMVIESVNVGTAMASPYDSKTFAFSHVENDYCKTEKTCMICKKVYITLAQYKRHKKEGCETTQQAAETLCMFCLQYMQDTPAVHKAHSTRCRRQIRVCRTELCQKCNKFISVNNKAAHGATHIKAAQKREKRMQQISGDMKIRNLTFGFTPTDRLQSTANDVTDMSEPEAHPQRPSTLLALESGLNCSVTSPTDLGPLLPLHQQTYVPIPTETNTNPPSPVTVHQSNIAPLQILHAGHPSTNHHEATTESLQSHSYLGPADTLMLLDNVLNFDNLEISRDQPSSFTSNLQNSALLDSFRSRQNLSENSLFNPTVDDFPMFLEGAADLTQLELTTRSSTFFIEDPSYDSSLYAGDWQESQQWHERHTAAFLVGAGSNPQINESFSQTDEVWPIQESSRLEAAYAIQLSLSF